MSAQAIEILLARLYEDAAARIDFLAAPRAYALKMGLSEVEAAALEEIDCEDLELAAESYARKRERR